MPNYSPKQLALAIAETLATADGQGVIISDQKFAQLDIEWARLIKGQADIDNWRGWIIVFLGIPTQAEDQDICHVDTAYRFGLNFFHFYQNDLQQGVTSADSFIDAIFAANEAINKDRTLGLAQQTVDHKFLQTVEDFGFANVGGGSVDQLCHIAQFSLDVNVLNFYKHDNED